MVDNHGPINNLILAVLVNIVYAQAMVALGLVLRSLRGKPKSVRVKGPIGVDGIPDSVLIGILQIIGRKAGSGVVASAEHGKGRFSV